MSKDIPMIDQQRQFERDQSKKVGISKIDNLIGQELAKPILKRQAWVARENPSQTPDPILLLGVPSVGKSEYARAYAHDSGLPLLELQPQSIPRANDLMDEIARFQYRPPLPEFPYRISLLLDEAHQMSKSITQSLLKATSSTDRMFVSEDGRKMSTVGISWILATTDGGELFDALISRCVMIRLRMYSQEEIAQIVHLNFPTWNREACDMVAHYRATIPREALAFARDMSYESRMTGEKSARVLADRIAEQHQIDKFGMDRQRLDILTALGMAPISRGRLCAVAQCKETELMRVTLPPLLAAIPGREPLITVSSKGFTITPAGLVELDRRDIGNNGKEAIPKSIRSLYGADDTDDKSLVSYADFEPNN